MKKRKILLFIGIASLFIFLTACSLIEGNPFCGACPVAPTMGIGFFFFLRS